MWGVNRGDVPVVKKGVVGVPYLGELVDLKRRSRLDLE